MKNITVVLCLAVLSLAAAPTGFAQDKPAAAGKVALQDSVIEMVNKGFNTFVAALSKSDFLEKVAAGEYTVLAPNDVAFRDKPKPELDAMLADKERLNAMIANHLIEGKLSTSDLKKGEVKTVGGTTLKAKVVDGKLKIGTATVVKQDVPSKNGVIHGLDAFLESK